MIDVASQVVGVVPQFQNILVQLGLVKSGQWQHHKLVADQCNPVVNSRVISLALHVCACPCHVMTWILTFPL